MTKFVWFNKETGKFSDSWDDTCWGHQQMIRSLATVRTDNFILIEYEVLKGDFEFCDEMGIAL